VHPTNTILYPNGIGMFAVGAANEGSKILLYNASPLSFQLDFLNGQTDTLHPWEANPWTLDGDTKQIQWTIDTDSLNVSTPPITTIFLTLYGAQEKLTGTYPVSLPYQTSLGGGTTSTNVGTVSAINNDGNPSGTTLIESTVLGQTGHVMLTNDGILNLFTLISGVMTELIQTQATGNPLLLGAASKITEILGNLTVDGNTINTGTLSTGTLTLNNGGVVSGGDWNFGTHGITASGLIVATTLQTNTLTDQSGNSVLAITPGITTRLQTNTGGTIALQINGATQFSITGNQFILASGNNIKLNNGNTIGGVSSFTGAATATYNHTYGSAPFFVIPMQNVAGSQNMGYNTVTATQVNIGSGSGLSFKCFCFG
jgi:hypothetical protein